MTKHNTKELKATAKYLKTLGVRVEMVIAKPTTSTIKPRKKAEQIGVPDALKNLDFQIEREFHHGRIVYKLPLIACTLYASQTRDPEQYIAYFTLANDPECIFLRGRYNENDLKALVDYASDLDLLLMKFKRLSKLG